MINFITLIGNFIGNLLTTILDIPIINNMTFGILLIIAITIGISIRFFKGGKGD